MIATLLKRLMSECKLQQKDLAEVLEVSIDRVKSLTSGRVKNLKREESEALVGKLGINATWLVTGEGPMYKAAQGPSAAQFGARLRMERVRLGFDEEEFADVAGISLAQYRTIEAGQAEADNAFKAALYQVEKIDASFLMTGMRIAPAAFELQGQEHRILHVYRASPEVRAAIDATVALGEDLLKAKHKAG